MADAPKISLAQQLEALEVATTRQRALATSGRVQAMRPKNAEEYDLTRLQAAVRTMIWLRDNHADLHEFLALPKAVRARLVQQAKTEGTAS